MEYVGIGVVVAFVIFLAYKVTHKRKGGTGGGLPGDPRTKPGEDRYK